MRLGQVEGEYIRWNQNWNIIHNGIWNPGNFVMNNCKALAILLIQKHASYIDSISQMIPHKMRHFWTSSSLGQSASISAITDYLFTLSEPPRVIDCLKEGIVRTPGAKYFKLNEGDTLSTTCIFYGDPKPSIRCYLLNKYGKVDNGQITSNGKRNFTQQIGGKLLQFHNVRRTVNRVECELDGYYAGKITHWVEARVDCKYSVISN